MIKVAPSILSADFAHLADDVALVERAGAQYLHIDVMDGHFVPNLSMGPQIVKSLREGCGMVFDTHLMLSEPHRYVEAFAEAGSDIITIHIECESDIKKTLEQIHALGKKAGLALNPDADLECVLPYREQIDMLLLMTVYAGFGGQKYIPEVNEKIVRAREMFGKNFDIEVDGGISPANISVPLKAGANVFVAGSAVFGADDPTEAVQSMLRAEG